VLTKEHFCFEVDEHKKRGIVGKGRSFLFIISPRSRFSPASNERWRTMAGLSNLPARAAPSAAWRA
jgi:hypothetical protein